MIFDALMHDGRQMLVAGVVKGEALADGGDGLVARRLRPAVGVEISNEKHLAATVVVGEVAEDGLGEN